MKKIGFIDYYISEWHANNYPKWIKEINDEYCVAYAWAEIDVSPVDNVTTDQWCEKFGAEKCATIEELCEKSDFIIILSPAFAGLYILYAATLTGKNSTVCYVTALIARRNKLDHHNTLPVEWLAASESMPLQRIISQMKPGKYHMLSVLSNDGMEQIGILNEQEICDNLLSDRNNLLLSDCIGKKK